MFQILKGAIENILVLRICMSVISSTNNKNICAVFNIKSDS